MSPTTHPLTLLVIDDEDDVREVVELTLTATASWTVLGASSGRAGIELARSAQPDAILLDLMMPELDGQATLEQLRADPATRGIPVVMLTASDTRLDVPTIAKPFDPMQLAARIVRLLGLTAPAGFDEGAAGAAKVATGLEEVWHRARGEIVARIDDIAAVAEAVVGGVADEVELRTARANAHALVGTFGVFGHQSVAREARRCEQTILRLLELDDAANRQAVVSAARTFADAARATLG